MFTTDMVDKLTPVQRHRNMSAIKGKNTTPELAVRKLLHRLGFRFKIHDKTLPGTPDIVLPKYRTVIMVHGCFWHMHGCSLSKIPETRKDFWTAKLEKNQARDMRQESQLRSIGWTVITVWECGLTTEQAMLTQIKLLIDKKKPRDLA